MIFNIAENYWTRIQDSTADIVKCGSFTTGDEAKILEYIKLGFFKQACTGTFKVRLHTSTNYSRVYAESDLIDMSDVDEDTFIGNILAYMNGVNLKPNTVYYVSIQAVTYTRIGDTNFIGWLHDLPFPTNDTTGIHQNEFPIRMEFFAR